MLKRILRCHMKISKSKMYSITRKIVSETSSLNDMNIYFRYHCKLLHQRRRPKSQYFNDICTFNVLLPIPDLQIFVWNYVSWSLANSNAKM